MKQEEFYGKGFGYVIEKSVGEAYRNAYSEFDKPPKKLTVWTKITRAYNALLRGWYDCLAELGYDRGC
jgi:coproporphyrinogen III oxidase